MKPVRLYIRRKTLVPVVRTVHQYRSDWKKVALIGYEYSKELFFILGGFIKTEAQFAKWIKDNYGNGEYSVLAWKTGKHNMWSFLKIKIMDTTWCRLEKKMTPEDKEKKDQISELRKYNKQLKEADGNEKEEIRKMINDAKDDLELTDEIINLDRKHRGPAPYLKSTMPLYREHDYESYGYDSNVTASLEVDRIW